MKAKKEKGVNTDEEMLNEAKKLSDASKLDAEQDRVDEWFEFVKKNDQKYVTVTGSDDISYLNDGIFDTALDYVLSRIRDVNSRKCSMYVKRGRKALAAVLTFNFSYDYDVYEWDGVSHNAEDQESFVKQMYSADLFYEQHKRRVVDELEKYIILGGALAKSIGSDAYPLWRAELIALRFKFYNFTDFCKFDEVMAFLDRIREAAKMTWADCEIASALNKDGTVQGTPLGTARPSA